MRNFIFLILLFTLVGCTSDNVDLMNLQKKAKKEENQESFGQAKTIEVNRDVDIVFILDNSSSMADHINNAYNNINEMTKSLLQDNNKSNLNIRIGVTSVWDEFKFNKLVPRRAKAYAEYEKAKEVNKNPDYKGANFSPFTKPFSRGELRPLTEFKDSRRKYLSGDRFIHLKENTTETLTLLRNTLNIPIEDHTCFNDTESVAKARQDKKGNLPPTIASDYSKYSGKYDWTLAAGKLRTGFHPTHYPNYSFEDVLDNYNAIHCGPENEEILSPVDAILDHAKKAYEKASTEEEKSKVFPSPASRSVIFVIISDAKDNIRKYGLINPSTNKPERVVTSKTISEKAQGFMDHPDSQVIFYGAINYVSEDNKCDETTREIDKGSLLVDEETLDELYVWEENIPSFWNNSITEEQQKKNYDHSIPFAKDLAQLIKDTGGKAANICSANFKDLLKDFGHDIRTKTLKLSPSLRTSLPSIPLVGFTDEDGKHHKTPIKVFVNNIEIPKKSSSGEDNWFLYPGKGTTLILEVSPQAKDKNEKPAVNPNGGNTLSYKIFTKDK